MDEGEQGAQGHTPPLHSPHDAHGVQRSARQLLPSRRQEHPLDHGNGLHGGMAQEGLYDPASSYNAYNGQRGHSSMHGFSGFDLNPSNHQNGPPAGLYGLRDQQQGRRTMGPPTHGFTHLNGTTYSGSSLSGSSTPSRPFHIPVPETPDFMMDISPFQPAGLSHGMPPNVGRRSVQPSDAHHRQSIGMLPEMNQHPHGRAPTPAPLGFGAMNLPRPIGLSHGMPPNVGRRPLQPTQGHPRSSTPQLSPQDRYGRVAPSDTNQFDALGAGLSQYGGQEAYSPAPSRSTPVSRGASHLSPVQAPSMTSESPYLRRSTSTSHPSTFGDDPSIDDRHRASRERPRRTRDRSSAMTSPVGDSGSQRVNEDEEDDEDALSEGSGTEEGIAADSLDPELLDEAMILTKGELAGEKNTLRSAITTAHRLHIAIATWAAALSKAHDDIMDVLHQLRGVPGLRPNSTAGFDWTDHWAISAKELACLGLSKAQTRISFSVLREIAEKIEGLRPRVELMAFQLEDRIKSAVGKAKRAERTPVRMTSTESWAGLRKSGDAGLRMLRRVARMAGELGEMRVVVADLVSEADSQEARTFKTLDTQSQVAETARRFKETMDKVGLDLTDPLLISAALRRTLQFPIVHLCAPRLLESFKEVMSVADEIRRDHDDLNDVGNGDERAGAQA